MKINIFMILTILWVGVIFYFTSKPAEVSRVQSGELLVKADIIKEDEVNTSAAQTARQGYVMQMQNKIRKYAHFIEYFALGALMMLSFVFRKKLKIYKVAVSLLLCLAVASLDEFFQRYVPGRGPSVKDIILDAKGLGVGIAFMVAINLVFMLAYRSRRINYDM